MLTRVRLLVDLLLHEVAVIALLQHRSGLDGLDRTLDRSPLRVEDPGALVVDADHVAVLQEAGAVGEAVDGQRVGTDEHLAVAVAHDQGRPKRAPRITGASPSISTASA